MIRAYKYRIYPNEEQQNFIRQQVGANRWFYNYSVDKIKKHYEESGKHLSCQYDITKYLPELKKSEETSWLKDIDSKSLIWTSMHVDLAYKNFFKSCKKRKEGKKDNVGIPQYKRKQYSGSYTTYQGINVFWNENKIKIPKLKTHIKCILHRKFNGIIKQATISYTNSNNYYISILVDDGIEKTKEKELNYDTVRGIDMGVKNSIITDDGTKYGSLKNSEKENKRYVMLSKRLSRKINGSKNKEKARLKLAKLSEKIANRRKNFIDNVTHDIICNKDTSAVCVENLNVKGLLSNHRLAKNIQDSSFNMIKTKLQYKSDWNGVKFIEIGKFSPSSKTCNKCGYINKELKLNERKWVCPNCGEIHDRDINAAINIKNEGYKILTEAQQ